MNPDSAACSRIKYPLLHRSGVWALQLGNGLEYDSQFIVYFCRDQMGLDVLLNLEMHFFHASLNQVRISPVTFHQTNQIPPPCLGSVFKLTLWKRAVRSCRLMRPEASECVFKWKQIIGQFCFIGTARDCFVSEAENGKMYINPAWICLHSHLNCVSFPYVCSMKHHV